MSRPAPGDRATAPCPFPSTALEWRGALPLAARCWWRPAARMWRITSCSPSRSRTKSSACAAGAMRWSRNCSACRSRCPPMRRTKGAALPVVPPAHSPRRKTPQGLLPSDMLDTPLVLVAHDLSPADMLQFKQSVFAGFVTDVGGKTSHTAIVARSMGIPSVVGARAASQLVRQDDWVIIDGDAGVVIVDPSPIILAEYGFRQR